MRVTKQGREGPALCSQCSAAARRFALWFGALMRVCVSSGAKVQELRTQSPRPLAAIAMPGSGIITGLLPSDAGMEMGVTRGGSDCGMGVGDAGT